MGGEFYLLLILGAAAVAQACFGRRRAVQPQVSEEERAAEKARLKEAGDRKHFESKFLDAIMQLRGRMAAALNNVAAARSEAVAKRDRLQALIRELEMLLRVQDHAEVVTDGMDHEFHHKKQFLHTEESRFLRAKEKAFTAIDALGTVIADLRDLNAELDSWARDKSDFIKKNAAAMHTELHNELDTISAIRTNAFNMCCEGVVGISDELVTPSVTRFRAECEDKRSRLQ